MPLKPLNPTGVSTSQHRQRQLQQEVEGERSTRQIIVPQELGRDNMPPAAPRIIGVSPSNIDTIEFLELPPQMGKEENTPRNL